MFYSLTSVTPKLENVDSNDMHGLFCLLALQ